MTDQVPTCLKFPRFSAVKNYLKRRNPAQDETRTESWKEQAGQAINLRRSGESIITEKITLFPGWATRRYGDAGNEDFGIDVSVSGFASRPRPPEQLSRSQRVFIRLAKSFASLPKLSTDPITPDSATEPSTNRPASASTESLPANIRLSPRLTEIPEERAIEALDLEFRRASAVCDDLDTGSDPSPSFVVDYAETQTQRNGNVSGDSPKLQIQAPADVLRRQHTNLEQRLHPFWASALPARTVRLHLFASPHHPSSSSTPSHSKHHPQNSTHEPLGSLDVETAADGSFKALFQVPWTDLSQHPATQLSAFRDRSKEHELHLSAQLLPPAASSTSSPTSTPASPTSVRSRHRSIFSQRERSPKQSCSSSPVPSTIQIPLSHTPIRVISDIDDTVKQSDIFLGTRTAFRNLFCKDLQENVIPAMSEWYAELWARGVRFHYVSNSPAQILPVINEFLQISQLPPGSIKLKSYTGGSFFNGVFEPHGARKRPGVVDILNAFPDSRFLLIGDSGQQDLELYADLARERPLQVIAVLIRYVDTCDPIDDTTGEKYIYAAGTRSTPLLSVNADDSPRRALSDRLRRGSSTSSSPILLSPLNITPRKARNNGGNGDVDYFTTTQFTTEPESDVTPSPLSASSSTSTKIANLSPSSSPITKTKSRSVPTPSPKISPSAYSPGYTAGATSSPSRAPLISRSSTSSSTFRSLVGVSDADKKRYALQKRVNTARKRMPGHIPLRVFRDPSECVEVEEGLKKMGL